MKALPSVARINFNAPLDLVLNELFGLNETAARMRGLMLVPFFGAWPLLAFILHWREIAVAALAVFSPLYAPAGGSPLLDLFIVLLRSLFAPGLLIHMLALYVPLLFGWLVAAVYLSDIFELGSQEIAQRFLSQAAFHFPRYERLVINSDKISKERNANTIVQIGGPGDVQVNLEYTAVFEKPDGTCDTVGPTTDLPGNLYTLDGFERLRTIIDLRDHHYRYEELTTRTKEGIRVCLQDVQILFSVLREKTSSDLRRPYSFSQRAIKNLVYHQLPEHWTLAMTDLVENDLKGFIRDHTLGELLAAVGEPEISRQIQVGAAIQNQIWQHRQHARSYQTHKPRVPRLSARSASAKKAVPHRRQKPHARAPRRFSMDLVTQRRTPSFVPRAQLSNFFKDFAQGFPRRAQLQGVSLGWINVGTFYTPQEIIPNQHIEAWQLTAENLVRCNNRVLAELKSQARAHELARILPGPLETYVQMQYEGRANDGIVAALIDEFEGKIRAAHDSFSDSRQNPAKELSVAEQHIRKYKLRRTRSQAHYL